MDEDRYSSIDEEIRIFPKPEGIDTSHGEYNERDDQPISAVEHHSSSVNKELPVTGYQEETAAEFAGPMPSHSYSTEDRESGGTSQGTKFGIFALVVSIISLFIAPIFLGIVGIILGFIARRKGASSQGAWAIGLGALSVIIGIFVMPFF